MGKDALQEIETEKRIGGAGQLVVRDVPVIDMGDFHNRHAEIADELWHAATQVGFFQLSNHGISEALIDAAFAQSQAFFDQSPDIKAQMALKPGTNAGWEHTSQVRPSTGTADQKESYQITLPRMAGLWPDPDALQSFKVTMLEFERQNWAVAMRVLQCFARKLDLAPSLFSVGHDPLAPEYQSTLRLLHYLPLTDADQAPGMWRAGAHTDFDCLTLLHQRDGQGGLQICPGKDAAAGEVHWSDVPPVSGLITCNIGDMLRRWSDDRLLSTLHRVRMPAPGESTAARQSIAYFAQANTNTVLQGPDALYPPITAHDYIQMRLKANFAGTAKPL
ncbi:isopenicillin N synthase family oxygenase [Shimia sp. R11_0]|uniref:isopenicillin N synthase family dioxygenase n=1 Tax=Shimia sp. R11_0 TaxID=2821096 RepID=UPI001ADC160D|nr:isopenicillin N synthase family oxygenase [Shimia sp. R11_0]MBO9479595.1 isopenicillin N synthase family oxygenase [Shimia sp. R11_0]